MEGRLVKPKKRYSGGECSQCTRYQSEIEAMELSHRMKEDVYMKLLSTRTHELSVAQRLLGTQQGRQQDDFAKLHSKVIPASAG